MWRALAGEEEDEAFSRSIIAILDGVKQPLAQTQTLLCGVSIVNEAKSLETLRLHWLFWRRPDCESPIRLEGLGIVNHERDVAEILKPSIWAAKKLEFDDVFTLRHKLNLLRIFTLAVR